MLERLINPERSYGEPEYSKISEQITTLRQRLSAQLSIEGRDWLDQLTVAYLHQENAVLTDAFGEGFWTAVELMLEWQRRKLS